MAEVVFKDARIQSGERIKIPKAVIDTLDIKSGEKVLIKFNAESRKIIIEEVK